MTKLRYVGTYAQEFPGPNETRVTLAPGEFLEDADTEDEEIKAGMERGELLDPENTDAPEGFVSENNVPDEPEPDESEPETPARENKDVGAGNADS